MAIALNNLAGAVGALRGHTAAEPLLRRATAIGASAFGPKHPHYAMLARNPADCLDAQGHVDEARHVRSSVAEVDDDIE